ncbi:hypothetical protein Taro_016268 [Colocasia esculenta]|uniref:Endopeptidase S2P n=1 Tax=Colocasia esculenta TaxID=4460 RepID=A0A843UND1_COLES|nr:hypothetical protein [Colocasia esculenta]
MRGERRTRRSRRSQTLLPLHARTRPSHTVSCWLLRVWFTAGVGFSFVALAVATMVLLQEFAWAIGLYSSKHGLHSLSLGWLFGVSGFSISLMGAGIMAFSTLVSVLVHEFGHAVAAASHISWGLGCIQRRLATDFAQVCCASDILCWHLAQHGVCSLTLIILPGLLYPFYIYGERPMVLSVSPSSPLSGYLSHGDIIMSLDGSNIHNPLEWMEKLTHLDSKMQNQSYYSRPLKISQAITGEKGYCVPSAWVEEREFQPMDNETSCPDDFSAFVSTSCCTSTLQDGDACDDRCGNTTKRIHCFNPKDVIKFKKCGGWQMGQTTQRCQCSKDECCLTPVQSSGKIWVEMSFSRPLSTECLKDRRNLTTMETKNFGSDSAACLQTFVFIGDVVSIANSIELSAYQPRSPSRTILTYLPNFLEKVLVSTFRVSASLALLNSMPVFLLDGESILEISLCYITWLSPRLRPKILSLLLTGGTLLCIIALLRTFSFMFIVAHGLRGREDNVWAAAGGGGQLAAICNQRWRMVEDDN